MPQNPYIAGNPVGDSSAFVGRDDVLREVSRVLRRPQDNAIVLYGQRRIGKTSILQYLVKWLPKQGDYCPVDFDLQDKATLPLGEVLLELARKIAHILNQPNPDLGADPETAFKEVWLPNVLENLPLDTALVILFDEFDVLADPDARKASSTFFPYLRQLLATDPQRLNFVFVLGRNVDDLDTIALNLFKGIPSKRVSLLYEDDTLQLIQLSEESRSLKWTDEAIEHIWQLTNGHPFLTQQVCSHVWERIYDDEPGKPFPVATLKDVDEAIPEALDASRNTLEWLWNGLPPAERVVISALAEAGPRVVTQTELEQLLHESGIRIVIRELQNAPQLLQDWDLIEPVDGGYRFRVELLRQWLTQNKPLSRVQDELDKVEPLAEDLYNAANSYYRTNRLAEAVPLLKQAVELNPNHIKANQLLADILLAQQKPDEAQQILERLYEYYPVVARPRLVQALLALAKTSRSSDKKLEFYGRVLEIDANQRDAITQTRTIWEKRGDSALKKDDLPGALEAYKNARLEDKVTEIEHLIQQQDIEKKLEDIKKLEIEEKYQQAFEIGQQLASIYPDKQNWTELLTRLEQQTHVASLYRKALIALEQKDNKTAQGLLVQVININPGYKEATRHLHYTVTGIDIDAIQQQLKTSDKQQSNEKPEKPNSVTSIGVAENKKQSDTSNKQQPNKRTAKSEIPIGKSSKSTLPEEPVKSSSDKNKNHPNQILWMINSKAFEARTAQLDNKSIMRLQTRSNWLISILLFVPLIAWTVWLLYNNQILINPALGYIFISICSVFGVLNGLFGNRLAIAPYSSDEEESELGCFGMIGTMGIYLLLLSNVTAILSTPILFFLPLYIGTSVITIRVAKVSANNLARRIVAVVEGSLVGSIAFFVVNMIIYIVSKNIWISIVAGGLVGTLVCWYVMSLIWQIYPSQYREFWTQFLDKGRQKTPLLKRTSSPKNQNLYIHEKGFVFCCKVTQKESEVRFFTNNDKSKKIFDTLSNKKKEIELALGHNLQWDRGDGSAFGNIKYVIPNKGLEDKEHWPELQDQMLDVLIGLENVLMPILKEIKLTDK